MVIYNEYVEVKFNQLAVGEEFKLVPGGNTCVKDGTRFYFKKSEGVRGRPIQTERKVLVEKRKVHVVEESSAPVKEKPVLTVRYDGATYTEGCINSNSVSDIQNRIKTTQALLRNYRRFAKKYGWEEVQ